MGLQSDIAREDETQFLCGKLAAKLEKYATHPEAVKVLKEVGREI